jgi:hypothetical protein
MARDLVVFRVFFSFLAFFFLAAAMPNVAFAHRRRYQSYCRWRLETTFALLLVF